MKMEVSLANIIPLSTAPGTLSHRMGLSRDLTSFLLFAAEKQFLLFCRIVIGSSEPGVTKLLSQNLLAEMGAEERCEPSLGLGSLRHCHLREVCSKPSAATAHNRNHSSTSPLAHPHTG